MLTRESGPISSAYRWRTAVVLCVLNTLAFYGWYRVRFAAYSAGQRPHDPEVLWAVIGALALAAAAIVTISQAVTILRNKEFFRGILALASLVAMVATALLLAMWPLDAVAHRHAVTSALRSTEYSIASGSVALLGVVHAYFVFAFFELNVFSFVMNGRRRSELALVRDERAVSGQ